MILGLLILLLIAESFYLGRFTEHRIETLITLSLVWLFGYVCGHHAWITRRLMRWRMRKWSKAKIVGWYFGKLVDEAPIMRKHANIEIVEMKDVQQEDKPK
jgi:hypothetical protein